MVWCSLKRRIAGGHVLLRFADLRDLESAARAVGQVSRDSEALALRVPHDGSLRSLKALINRLDENAVEVDSLSAHTPDLDDVFLALGIVDRFRTMAIARVSVLTGHVLASLIQTMLSITSGFVPTDSMPTVLRWFAEYQPFTPLRGAHVTLATARVPCRRTTSSMQGTGWAWC